MTKKSNKYIIAFQKGLMQPSLGSVIGIVLFMLCQFIMANIFVTEQSVATLNPKHLMLASNDWDAYVTVNALKLKHGLLKKNAVVILGNSFMLENLNNFETMEEELSALGVERDVVFLATDAQTLWEKMILIDQIPDYFNGIIVFALSPMEFCYGYEFLDRVIQKPRMALYSPLFIKEIERLGYKCPRHTHFYFTDNNRFFIARISQIFKYIFRKKDFFNQHYYTKQGKPWDQSRWDEKEAILYKRFGTGEEIGDRLQLFDRLLTHIKQRTSAHILVLDMPCHSRTEKILRTVYDNYRIHLETVRKKHTFYYTDFNQDTRIRDEDYYDFGHVYKENARKIIQSVVCEKLRDIALGE